MSLEELTKVANCMKTLEGHATQIATLKISKPKVLANVKMDPTAFSKMSLRNNSPLPSVLQRNTETKEDTVLNGTESSNLGNGLKSRALRRKQRSARHKQAKKDASQPPSTDRHESDFIADEEDGGVLLNPLLERLQAVVPVQAQAVTSLPIMHHTVTTSIKQQGKGSNAGIQTAHMSASRVSTLVDSNAPVDQALNVGPLSSAHIPPHRPNQSCMPYAPLQYNRVAIDQRAVQLAGRPPLMQTPAGLDLQRATASFSTASSLDRGADWNNKSTFQSRSSLDPGHPERPTEPAPEPEAGYLMQSLQAPRELSTPQSLLLVLDLNGTLVHRARTAHRVYPRPCLPEFLKYCLDHHHVFIWSSARPSNVNRMCKTIFQPQQLKRVVAIWGRDTLNLSVADYNEKVQVYKRLDSIWSKQSVQELHPQYSQDGRWSQANTVLIDDSLLKAAKQPYNHIAIPEYMGPSKPSKASNEDEVLAQVVAYLEEARRWDDVSSFMREEKFTVNAGYSWAWGTGRRLAPDSRGEG